MKPKKNLWRVVAATAAAVATLLGGGVAVSSAVAVETHDISQVGSVTVKDVPDNRETNKGKSIDHKWDDSNHIRVKVVLEGTIGDVNAVNPGDTVTIPVSSGSATHFFADAGSGSDNLKDAHGHAVFSVSYVDQLIKLTRTDTAAQGRFSFELDTQQDHYQNQASRAGLFSTSSIWTFGASSYTFSTPPVKNGACNSNDGGASQPGYSQHDEVLAFASWNCTAVADSANGRKPSVNTNDQVYWAHVIPNNGSIRFDRFVNGSKYWLAVDEHTPGNGIDAGPQNIDAPAMKTGADVSTLAAAKTSLQAGQYGVTANQDGSVDIAINWGSRTASHDFYQYWDDVTNNLVKNANGIIEYYAVYFHFDFSEHDQAQTASVTWDSTNMDVPEAGRHGTITLSNSIASNLGSDQAEIIYAKNADGKGKTVKPGDSITFPGEGQIMTLYAQWKAQPASLVYDANVKDATGTTAEQKGVTDQNVPVRDNGFKRSDYTFVSWNTQADDKGKTYRKGDQYTLPAGTSTLYAQWKEIPGALSWAKADKETDKVLAGSEWDLTDKQDQTVHVTDNGELDQAEDEGRSSSPALSGASTRSPKPRRPPAMTSSPSPSV